MKDSLLYIWLQLALGVCSRLAGQLFTKFHSMADIYNCNDFSFLGDKREKYIKRLECKDTAEAFEVLKRCQGLGVTVTGYYDDLYPSSLRKISAPPVVLYSIGDFRCLDKLPCIAVVGTRDMSDYGKAVAEDFAAEFCKSGACVISGLAKGVDTAAHRGAIMAGGYTVGVLGNPIGDVYPKENLKAFQTLYQRGLVISEMYPGCPRTKADFPNRNRIISGISDAVLVIEAGEASGALITARYGAEQGKAVFAVPGAIGSDNAGTNTLIKTGVPAALNPNDVLSALLMDYPEVLNNYQPSATKELRSYGNGKKVVTEVRASAPVAEPKRQESEPQSVSQKIVSALESKGPLSADELTVLIGASVSDIMTELTLLEIDGSVVASAGGRYILTKA